MLIGYKQLQVYFLLDTLYTHHQKMASLFTMVIFREMTIYHFLFRKVPLVNTRPFLAQESPRVNRTRKRKVNVIHYEKVTLVFSLSSQSKETFKCHRCPEIKCLNLSYHHSKKYENIGHELYIYKLLGKKMEKSDELSKYVCRNGNLLEATCFLVNPIIELEEKSYLKDVLYQSAKDLKASMFLAFSGHYRQAMQVLRCSFENLISGVYFHSDFCKLQKNNSAKEEIARLEKRFNDWKKTGRVNIRSSFEVLRRISFLNRNEEKDWKKLYSNLSMFIHTPEEYICHIKHKDVLKKMECLASTYFSEDALRTWSNSFQKVFVAILKIIVEYHRFVLETESGKIAIGHLLPIEKELEIPERTRNLLFSR